MVKNLGSDFLYRTHIFRRKETYCHENEEISSCIISRSCTYNNCSTYCNTCFAATTAETTATDATPEQEVTVKKPAKATVAAKNDSVKVTIKKVAGAAGYEVQYSTSKKFTKKTTKSKTTKKTSYTVKSLKDKTTYYVRVRAYKLDKNGKKVYSKWTSTTKVKTK